MKKYVDKEFLILGTCILVVIVGIIWYQVTHWMPEGEVVDKDYYPPYTVVTNKVPTYHPARYTVTITDGEKKYTTDAPKEIWNLLEGGDTLNIETWEVRK